MTIKYIMILSIFLPFYLFAQIKEDAHLKKINVYLYQDPDKAISEGVKLEEKATENDTKINYLVFLSKAYTAKRDLDKSLETLLKAQELLKKSNNPIIKIDVYIIIAIQYQHMELYNKSFEMLDKAEYIAQNLDAKLDTIKYSWLGKSNAVKGIIYRTQGNYEIAHSKLLKAIYFFKKADESIPNNNNISIVYYNIAYNYIDQTNYKEAHNYFLKSLYFAEKSDAKSLQAFALKGLADNYAIQDKPEKSLQLLNKANLLASKIGDLTLNSGIYKGLANNYLTIGDFNSYIKNNDIYKKIVFDREQIELKSINSFIDNLRINYLSYTDEIKSRTKLICSLFIVLGIIITVFLGYKIFIIIRLNKLKVIEIDKLTGVGK